MARGFIAGDRNQLFLLPPSVDKWVPVNHMVRFIWDIVKQMNLTAFYFSYRTEGRPPYDPAMMLAVPISHTAGGGALHARFPRLARKNCPIAG